nr:hypothetical protein [Lactiplantibacillus plantarum]
MRSRTDNTKQVVVYVVMRDQQANVLFAHRVYFSERRAKNYCKRMNNEKEFTGYYYINKAIFFDWKAFILNLQRPPGSKKLAKNRKLGTGG